MAKTMILLTDRASKSKLLYTGLKSLIDKNPELGLKYNTVYGYTHTSGVEYATDKVIIERINIVHAS